MFDGALDSENLMFPLTYVVRELIAHSLVAVTRVSYINTYRIIYKI